MRDIPPTPGLGADLRALRRVRGLTLQALADRLGKSVGWLSQVERDISTPDFTDLEALADAFDVPISLFFGQPDAPPAEMGRIVRSGARRQIGGASGLTEALLSPDLTDDFEVIHSTFAPGSSSGRMRSRATQEVGYLLTGRLTLWLGSDQFDLAPGDSFRVKGETYAWENPHSEPASAIWVIAPPLY